MMETAFVAHGQEVSKIMYCRCGYEMSPMHVTVEWKDAMDRVYSIHDVPCLQCDHCGEAVYVGHVEFNLAIMAEEMEGRAGSDSISYRERF